MKICFRAVLALVLTAVAGIAPSLAQDARSERLRFPGGASGIEVQGQISGHETVDYILGARAGQRMSVTLRSRNRFAYFNVLAPGSDSAVFVGSRDGARFDAALPASGDYRIRVYLMRNAARRNERARFSLSASIAGRPAGRPERPGRPAPDYADGLAGGPDFWEVTGVGGRDYLNVRTGPGTRNPVIARLSDGEVLRNLGCRMVGGQRWCNVERPRGGDNGWVAGSYLREASVRPRPGRPEPPRRPGRPSRPDPETDAHGPDFWEVTGIGGRDYLNVRSGPGTRNPVIARLSDGEVMRNLGCRMVDGQRWCNVERPRGGDTGWVAGAFLREAAAQPQPGRPERPRRPRFNR